MTEVVNTFVRDLLAPGLDPPGYVVSVWPLIRCDNGEALLAMYDLFCRKLEPHLPDGAELYPASALHITIATMLSFVPPSDAAGVPRLDEEMLSKTLNQAHKHPYWPRSNAGGNNAFSSRKLEITVECPQLTDTFVGIFFNQGPGIPEIRNALREAIKDTPVRDVAHFPNIVHSSFLRFSSKVDPKSPEYLAFRSAFEACAAEWVPVKLGCDHIDLIRESSPYMHMLLPAHRHIVATVPFVSSACDEDQ